MYQFNNKKIKRVLPCYIDPLLYFKLLLFILPDIFGLKPEVWKMFPHP